MDQFSRVLLRGVKLPSGLEMTRYGKPVSDLAGVAELGRPSTAFPRMDGPDDRNRVLRVRNRAPRNPSGPTSATAFFPPPPGNNGLGRRKTRRDALETLCSPPFAEHVPPQPPNVTPIPTPSVSRAPEPPAPGGVVGVFVSISSPHHESSRNHSRHNTADRTHWFEPSPLPTRTPVHPHMKLSVYLRVYMRGFGPCSTRFLKRLMKRG
jgi:hypothetical protein